MNFYTLLMINIITAKIYNGRKYHLIKDKTEKTIMQQNLGPGKEVVSVVMLYYPQVNNTKDLLPVSWNCNLLKTIDEDRNISKLIYCFPSENIQHRKESVACGPIIRYHTNSKDREIVYDGGFCDKFCSVNIFDLRQKKNKFVSSLEEKYLYFQFLIFNIPYEYRFNDISRDKLKCKLKEVNINKWYVPKYFTKPSDIKGMWFRLLDKAKQETNCKEYLRSAAYILQSFYVTSFYKGGTYGYENVIESILGDVEKKEKMIETIYFILNDIELIYRAMWNKQKIHQKDTYLSNSNLEMSATIFYGFSIQDIEIPFIKSENNKIIFLLSNRKFFTPEFYFYEDRIFIKKRDLHQFEIERIIVQYETLNGESLTKEFTIEMERGGGEIKLRD